MKLTEQQNYRAHQYGIDGFLCETQWRDLLEKCGHACMKDDDVEVFDSAMYDLYEWADTALDENWNGKKMCWVKTVF